MSVSITVVDEVICYHLNEQLTLHLLTEQSYAAIAMAARSKASEFSVTSKRELLCMRSTLC